MEARSRSRCAIGPLPAVTALAFRGDDRLLAVGTYGQVVLWDLYDGPAGGRASRHSRAGPRPLVQSRWAAAGRRRGPAGPLGRRAGLLRARRHARSTTSRGTTTWSSRWPCGPIRHSLLRRRSIRPSGSGTWAWAGPTASSAGIPTSCTPWPTHPTAGALLTAGKDRTIKRVSTRTLKEERTYSGHDDDVLALAVHPDGKRFVSAGNEPQLRWWTFDADKPQARRGGHSGPVQQLAFSGDGRRLISAGGDRLGTALGWADRRADPATARPDGVAIRRRDLRRRPAGRGGRLGRPGPALGRRVRPAARGAGPAAVRPERASTVRPNLSQPSGWPSVPPVTSPARSTLIQRRAGVAARSRPARPRLARRSAIRPEARRCGPAGPAATAPCRFLSRKGR